MVCLKSYLRLLFLFCLLALTALAQDTQTFDQNTSPLPPPSSPVTDTAGVISPSQKAEIEQKILEFERTTNPKVQMAVVVVRTTGDRDIFDYSLAIARGWGIGEPNGDKAGLLLVVAVNDRKYFTQISRHLEDELPDGLVGSIQRNYLVPEFKAGNFGQGISDTIDQYIVSINERNSGAPAKIQGSNSDKGIGWMQTCCFLAIFLVFVIFLIVLSRNNGGRGGRGGGLGSIIIPVGSSGGWDSRGSSSWGGGSGWSGGSSGGGWGGFGGGGDFGGGGSGGSW